MAKRIAKRVTSSVERENIVAGAAGVAALGSVIGMVVASGIIGPLLGTVIGAASGGALGGAVNMIVQRRREAGQSRQASPLR